MKNDSSCQDMFEAFPVSNFWLKMALFYPEISKTALKKAIAIQLYMAMRICLLTLLNVKTKQRNRLEIEQDICCSLSSREPRIKNFVANMKAHPSH